MTWDCSLAWGRGLVWLLILLAAGLLAACRQEQDTLELDYDTMLPEGWEAIGSWQEVNIDGDEAPEYLLLFTYEAGQAGAMIYDAQIAAPVVGVVDVSATPTVALMPVPLQPFGYYKPYRLFPSTWSFTFGNPPQVGHGFVAAPADAQNIVVTQIDYGNRPPPTATPDVMGATPAPVTSAMTNTAAPTGELLLAGGNRLLTFVWWKNPLEGYGVTQVTAPGGWQGIDWEAWQKNPSVIESFSGLAPLDDYRARSLLCRVTAYARAGAPPAIEYSPRDMGILFCPATIPASPYYPEGVVAAYLLWGGAGTHAVDVGTQAALLAPGVNSAQVEAEVAGGRLAQEKLNDLVTYPTVLVTAQGLLSEGPAPTTTVCVELAELADASLRRWLLFTLQYQPPNLQTNQADRWAILGATLTPGPVADDDGSYCAGLLAQ